MHEVSGKFRAPFNMKRSKMLFTFWEKNFIIALLVVLILPILFKELFDVKQSQAFESHLKSNEVGILMRSLSFFTKEATKYKEYSEVPNIDTSNYYNKSFQNTVTIKIFQSTLTSKLLPVTDLFVGQRTNLTFQDPG
jgi:hypothetical protein